MTILVIGLADIKTLFLSDYGLVPLNFVDSIFILAKATNMHYLDNNGSATVIIARLNGSATVNIAQGIGRGS